MINVLYQNFVRFSLSEEQASSHQIFISSLIEKFLSQGNYILLIPFKTEEASRNLVSGLRKLFKGRFQNSSEVSHSPEE